MRNLTKSGVLGLLIVLQAGCVAFFMGDVLMDLLGWEATGPTVSENDTFEYFVVAVLALSLGLTAREFYKMVRRQSRMDDQLALASGAFAEVIARHFDEWGLSSSERDVAMMAIKGLSIAEMAEARRTREGTIKAQSAAVYRKAGVAGRLQLMSYFLEELIAEPTLPAAVKA